MSIIWDFRLPDKGAEDTKPETPRSNLPYRHPLVAHEYEQPEGKVPRRRKPGENPKS